MATRVISTKLAIDGESEYRASMARINGEIKTLQSSLKLTESTFQTNANSMEALTAKGDALNELYKAQESKVKVLNDALENARAAGEAYSKQHEELTEKIEANNKALEELKETSGDTSEEQSRLNAENKDLTQQLEQCDANLAAVDKGVNSWQMQLNTAKIKLNDLDAELKLNEEYLDEARNSSDGCATSIDRFGDRVKAAADKSNDLRDALSAAGVIAALKKTADTLEACVDSSVEYESAMAGVAKTTDLTEAELRGMATAIQDLSTRIPASTTEIAGVVEAAGQLGIAKDDLLSFSEVMVNLGVATNLSSDQAATALAKFANVVGMAPANYERLGSTIVALGNSFATTESDIVSMATRLSSTGNLVGLSESQVMAISTALSSVGIEAEAGGSAISKLLKKLETMVATGDTKLEDFAAVAGMSAEEFAKKWGEDAVSALGLFIDGLGEVDKQGGSSVAVLEDLGITEVRMSNAVLSLASSHGVLNSALATADSAWASNTALANEAATRYETTESKLQMLSNACNNVKIAVGDKLTPAVSGLATAGTSVLSWAAEMISNSETLVPLVASTATAIGVLSAGIIGYTGVTKLAAGAMGLFTAVMDANPIFLAATAVAALAAGIAVLVGTMESDPAASVENLTTAAQALPDAVEQANASYADSETKILAAADAATSYIDRLRELESQGDLTVAQQAEYRAIVDKIRQILPDVNIVLDEQTGLLVGGADALRDQVEAWKNVAIQEALATKYKAQMEAWAAAELEVYENRLKLNDAVEDGNQLAQKSKEIQDAITQKQNTLLNTDIRFGTDEWNKLNNELSNLNIELIQVQGQIDENQDTQEALTKAVKIGAETAEKYADEVNAAQDALDKFSSTAESAASATNGASGSMGNNTYAIQTVKENLKELAEAYKKAYDSAYDSISGQIGLFDTFEAKISEDTNSVEKMVELWNAQADNLKTYNENLQKAAEYGLDKRLIESLSGGSAESAGQLATIISKIDELGGSTSEMSNAAEIFVTNFNAAFARTEDAKEDFATTVAGMETDLKNSIAAMEQTASEIDFSGYWEAVNNAFSNVGVDFQTIGSNAGIGMAQGISDTSGQVSSAATDMATDMTAATMTALGEASPSKVFHEIGANADVGMEQGVKENIPVVLAAVSQMGQGMTSQMQQSARLSVESFTKEFNEIQERTAATCASIVPAAVGAASGLPDSMADIGVQSINGMILGMRSRSSALYSTISSIVSNSIECARIAAAVHSPSKKTTEIFEFVGDGMVVGLENRRQKIRDTAQDVVNNALSLDTSGKMQEITDSIDTRMPDRMINAMVAPAADVAPATNNNVVNVNLHIEHFENRSDRDLDEVADYIEDRIQSKYVRREAAFG